MVDGDPVNGDGAPPCWVGYLRVSSDQQADEGHGLDVQRASIEQWADRAGAHLVAVIADEGVSGALEPPAREGWAEVRRMAADNGAGIVVARMDRLSRVLIGQEAELRALQDAGVPFESVAEPGIASDTGNILEDDPSRIAFRQVLGVFADYERRVIVQRMARGKARKKAQGGWGGGMPPYGWTPAGGELEPHPAEQTALTIMRAYRAEGMGYGRIADRMNERGVKSKLGKRWHASAVSSALSHPLNQEDRAPVLGDWWADDLAG